MNEVLCLLSVFMLFHRFVCLSGPPDNAPATSAKPIHCHIVCLQPNVFDGGTSGFVVLFVLLYFTFLLFILFKRYLSEAICLRQKILEHQNLYFYLLKHLNEVKPLTH